MSVDNDMCSRIFDNLEVQERLILYVIGADNIPIKSLVNLQKVIFISSRCLPDILDGSFFFETHKKGPYSKDIDETVMDFTSNGLVCSKNLLLTDKGKCVYDFINEKIKDPLKSSLDYWKKFCYDLTEDEFLTFIYYSYPDTVENSEVVDRIQKDAVKNTISLVNKDKITAGRGAELLEMRYFDFEDLLRKHKVRWKS